MLFLSLPKGEQAIVRQSFVDSIRLGDAHNGFVSRIGQKRPSFHPPNLASQTFPPKFPSKSSREFPSAAEEEKEKEEEKTIVAMVIKMARQNYREQTFSRAFEKRFRQAPFPGQLSYPSCFFLNPLHYCSVSSLSPRKQRSRVSSFTLFSSIIFSNRGFQSIVVRISAIFFFLFLPPSKVAQSCSFFISHKMRLVRRNEYAVTRSISP